MRMGRELPPEAMDAFYIEESGCLPTMTEIDAMPQSGVDRLIDYRAVRRTIENGTRMEL